ncbi:LysR substrate-binding domain-containing protein [Chromobacterium haemolyticum]|nr:LysR substrate-binding domain-containing protein [Chromobacterium haemolyticum]
MEFSQGQQRELVTVDGRRQSDDGEVVRRWALEGLGIAYKSRLDALDDLRAGRLLPLLEDWQTEAAPLCLVIPHRLMLSPAVAALREHLQACLQDYLAAP